MSEKNNNNDFFANQQTRLRRAWIDSAVQVAREYRDARRAADDAWGVADDATSLALVGRTLVAPDSGLEPQQAPALYLAWSAGERRSAS